MVEREISPSPASRFSVAGDPLTDRELSVIGPNELKLIPPPAALMTLYPFASKNVSCPLALAESAAFLDMKLILLTSFDALVRMMGAPALLSVLAISVSTTIGPDWLILPVAIMSAALPKGLVTELILCGLVIPAMLSAPVLLI